MSETISSFDSVMDVSARDGGGAVSGELRSIRVLLADDHPVVRLGLQRLIDDQPDMLIVAEARSGDDAVASLAQAPEVAVLDYHLGSRHDGLWATRQIKRGRPATRVLIYSAFADSALAVAAIVAGADGVLGKASLGEELCDAIRRLAEGGQYLPEVPQPVIQAMRSQLRPEDRASFGMLMAGIPSASIRARLGLSEAELEGHRAAMLLAIAPAAAAAHERGDMPLDYDRAQRHTRFPIG